MFCSLKSNQINITFLINTSEWLTLCNLVQNNLCKMYLLHNLLYHCSLTKFKLNSNWFMFLYEYFIVFFIVNRLPTHSLQYEGSMLIKKWSK